jgi:hypothetical protein
VIVRLRQSSGTTLSASLVGVTPEALRSADVSPFLRVQSGLCNCHAAVA